MEKIITTSSDTVFQLSYFSHSMFTSKYNILREGCNFRDSSFLFKNIDHNISDIGQIDPVWMRRSKMVFQIIIYYCLYIYELRKSCFKKITCST